MLDALSDFWKPSKKTQADKLRVDQLQVGSAIVFGFVPQSSLSGRRLQISAINTYQFGSEALTSFVLSQEREPGISMIVAESEGEQYLALSRRITISDRIKMFNSVELDAVIEKADATQLSCKENSEFKGWTVAAYRREIQGMKGFLFSGDFRKAALPASSTAQEFKYVLLASESNEHAIEIEKYADGRIEMYATVYRRTSDISEVSQPMRPDLKLATPAQPEEKPVPVKQDVKSEPVKLQEFTATPVVTTAPSKTPEAATPFKPVAPEKPAQPTQSAQLTQEKKTMSPLPEAATETLRNFSTNGASPKLSSMQAANQSQPKQESKPVNKANGMETNDAVECDLRVANKIIEEAIRNEMRLSDVVRRVIELPVSHQEAVHIPVTLSDEDYALLAIRYGISASDRNAIKSRIIEDLNGFSGLKK